MIIESGRLALARQQHSQAEAAFESYRDELTQLKVKFDDGKNDFHRWTMTILLRIKPSMRRNVWKPVKQRFDSLHRN